MRLRLIGCLLIGAWAAAQNSQTISGVVMDAATRLPLQGALVAAAGGHSIRTDGEGRYSLSVEPGSDVQIHAGRTGYFTAITSSAGATASLNFELRPMLKISGTVEDYDSGEMIPGCHVFAWRSVFALGKVWLVPAGLITADTRNGHFAIRNLEPGSYILEIVPAEVQPIVSGDGPPRVTKKFHGWSFYPDASRVEMAAPIALAEGGDAPVRIRLRARPARSISGRTNAAARVELIRQVASHVEVVALGDLKGAGSFRIDNLPEGEYQLRARTPGGSYDEAPVSVGDHDVTDVSQEPRPVSVISGVVRMVEPDVDLPQGVWVVSGERQVRVLDGKFEIEGSPGAETLRLAGLPDGFAVASVQEFPQYTYLITSKTGRLRGNIGERVGVLLPGGRVFTQEFDITLAPGNYRIAILNGEEKHLAEIPAFVEMKVAADGRGIEIKAGETTVFAP